MKATVMTLLKVAGIVLMLIVPTGAMAQDAGEPDQAYTFSKEELTQMLAPIALYPDSLVAQMLMASTYPVELVEAERWRRQNLGLEGQELDDALKDKSWDPSVKSLCHFPNVLFAMSEKLDQTRKLGDAFLAQEDDVMATIQDLRRKAEAQGNLRTTPEQTVVNEQDDIRIEPADTNTVYVPVYDPLYVYGPWWYPSYPPYYWYYPPGYGIVSGYIGFAPGIFIGFNLFSWTWFDWHSHRVHVDIDRTRRFHHYDRRRDFGDQIWRHNPFHRRGVAYRDRKTGEIFQQRRPQTPLAGPEPRGYPKAPAVQQRKPEGAPPPAGVKPRPGTTQPQKVPSGQQPPAALPKAAVTTPRPYPARAPVQSPVVRDTPFRGVGDGSFERRAVIRGETSIRSSAPLPQRNPRGSWGGQMRQPAGGFQGSGAPRKAPAQGKEKR